jgi:hypothetical protein
MPVQAEDLAISAQPGEKISECTMSSQRGRGHKEWNELRVKYLPPNIYRFADAADCGG